MDIIKYVSKPEEVLRSSAMSGRAGASMVDAIGEMKVKLETRIVAVHFRRRVQFRGLSGSSSPVHVT